MQVEVQMQNHKPSVCSVHHSDPARSKKQFVTKHLPTNLACDVQADSNQ